MQRQSPGFFCAPLSPYRYLRYSNGHLLAYVVIRSDRIYLLYVEKQQYEEYLQRPEEDRGGEVDNNLRFRSAGFLSRRRPHPVTANRPPRIRIQKRTQNQDSTIEKPAEKFFQDDEGGKCSK